MKKAPEFELQDQNGKTHTLSQYKGSWVVLYFYPKDDTPGCTIEACSFRDGMDELREEGVVVLGVSKDSIDSHKKFVNKHDLNFTLLSDESTDMITSYDAIGTKKMFGKEYQGVKRITYLIDPEGNIAKKYEKVKVSDHASEILEDVRNLKK